MRRSAWNMIGAVILSTVLVAGCTSRNEGAVQDKSKVELTVSAAASLKDALEEVEKQYVQEHPNVEVSFNYGSSGTLQKQIEQGAPVDMFFSAGMAQMEALAGQDLVAASTTLLRNELVLIIPKEQSIASNELGALTDDTVKRIAIGQPESVPAGQYAKETLQNVKLWDALQDKLVYAKDVRQVLSYVESGNADAGFVYRTDALASDRAKIVLRIEEGLHKPIDYPVGIMKRTEHREAAQDFYQYLQGADAEAIFVKYGFTKPVH